MTDNTEICDTLKQRNQYLLLSPPPIRYNPISPYPTYTKAQLDMRRKAEILQYSNKSSNQNCKLTKKQQYANLTSGQFKRLTRTIVKSNPIYDASNDIIGYTNSATVYNVASCPSDLYLSTPSTSCDVPGPLVYLQYDPTIPLYNYAVNNNALSILSEYETDKWVPYTNNNILAIDTNTTVFMKLVIQNVENNNYTFTINTPIGLYAAATNASSGASGKIQISNVALSVYYNDTEMSVNPTFSTYTDASMSYMVTSNSSFAASQYIGNLMISNLILASQNGYVYDMKMTFTLSEQNKTGTYTDFVKGVYLNIADSNIDYQINSILEPQPSNIPDILPFSITGV